MTSQEACAKMAALANLPMGWVFETPRRFRDDLILLATGPAGDEIETCGGAPRAAGGAVARGHAARGRGGGGGGGGGGAAGAAAPPPAPP
ncbi:MAG: hypothetical protein LH650_01000, partial [Chloroflexi bacterium]|nr:hypothetical protein [Chloroflexota bacterium]